jgi:hypothetical protein
MTGRDVVVFCAWALVTVGALVVGASYLSRDLDLAGAVAVSVVTAAVLTSSRRIAVPDTPAPGVAPAAEASRRPFRRLFWLRERLLRGARSDQDFRLAVVPVLAELADDRLRRGHAIDRRAQPARARELLGDELADLLDGRADERGDRPPTPTQISRFLDRIERL